MACESVAARVQPGRTPAHLDARPTVHAQLAAILPPAALLTSPEETQAVRVRRPDALSASCRRPSRCPRTRRRSSRSCGAATRRSVPVVARGAGTSLSGGALPRPARASCCRSRSSAASSRSIRWRAPRSCSRACATSRSPRPPPPYGLYYAPDPSSQIACSIGGNVAENAGGVHCLKYGLTVHNVRRVRGVLDHRRGRRVRRRRARQRRATTCSRSSTAARACSR